MPIMKAGAGAFDFLEDVGSLCGPDERLGVLVVAIDVVIDGGDEFFHAAWTMILHTRHHYDALH